MNIANEYWNKHFPSLDTHRKETDYAYKIRNTWKDLGFPSYPTVDDYLNLPKGTTNTYAQKYGYTNIRQQFDELQNQIRLEQQEKEQKEMEADYSDIWKTARNRVKYRINDLTKKIQKCNDEKELEKLWKKYFEALSELKSLQPTERVNKHLPNIYKDDGVDKLEIEQKGEFNLNQNVKFENEEEKLERYANYFKQIKEDIGDSTSEELNK